MSPYEVRRRQWLRHELLTKALDGEPSVETVDGMRDIESLEIRSIEQARVRVTHHAEVSARLSAVDFAVLVLGRDQDELRGIFRLPTSCSRSAVRMPNGRPEVPT